MNGRSRSLMLAAAVVCARRRDDGLRQQEEELRPPPAADDDGGRDDNDQHRRRSSSVIELRSSVRAPPASRRSRPPATASSCPTSQRSFSKAITGVGANDFEARAKLLKEFADKTPSDIRPDFEVLADAFTQVRLGAQGHPLHSGQVPDAATLAKLQQLSTSIDQAAVTKASTHISAWAQKQLLEELTHEWRRPARRDGGRRRAPRVVAAEARREPHRDRQPAPRAGRSRVGDRRRDRQGRQGLHPRQRRRVRPSARRAAAGAVSISLDEEGGRSRRRTPRAISAGTAPPAPASSTRSRPRPSSTRCACSAPGSRAPGRCCSPACAGRSSRASTSST